MKELFEGESVSCRGTGRECYVAAPASELFFSKSARRDQLSRRPVFGTCHIAFRGEASNDPHRRPHFTDHVRDRRLADFDHAAAAQLRGGDLSYPQRPDRFGASEVASYLVSRFRSSFQREATS